MSVCQRWPVPLKTCLVLDFFLLRSCLVLDMREYIFVFLFISLSSGYIFLSFGTWPFTIPKWIRECVSADRRYICHGTWPAGWPQAVHKVEFEVKEENRNSTCMHVCGLHACCQIADNILHSNLSVFLRVCPCYLSITISVTFIYILFHLDACYLYHSTTD